MKKYSYIGIAFIILIFGIYSIPKIVNKFKTHELVKIGEVPSYEFTNQDGKLISNSFYKDKVYVIEFFFTTCPTICPKMNENMVKLQNEYYTYLQHLLANRISDRSLALAYIQDACLAKGTECKNSLVQVHLDTFYTLPILQYKLLAYQLQGLEAE